MGQGLCASCVREAAPGRSYTSSRFRSNPSYLADPRFGSCALAGPGAAATLPVSVWGEARRDGLGVLVELREDQAAVAGDLFAGLQTVGDDDLVMSLLGDVDRPSLEAVAGGCRVVRDVGLHRPADEDKVFPVGGHH